MDQQVPQLIDFRASLDERGSLLKVFGRPHGETRPQLAESTGDSFLLQSGHKVFRGLHVQEPPFDQSKAVFVLDGLVRVFCVRVIGGRPDARSLARKDITRGNFGLVAPQGWALGILTVSEASLVWVSASKPYQPNSEITIGIKSLIPQSEWKGWKFSEKDGQA